MLKIKTTENFEQKSLPKISETGNEAKWTQSPTYYNVPPMYAFKTVPSHNS